MIERRIIERKKKTKRGWIDRGKSVEKKDKRKRYSVLLTCYN